jgi:hypothetical protein
VANGVVYVGSADGNVYALNARTGARLAGYRQMAALATHKSSVRNGCHLLKLITRHAVRTPNDGHWLGDIHHTTASHQSFTVL